MDPAEAMLRETREELTRADAKATTLLMVNGLFITALVAGAIAGDWTPRDLPGDVEWAFWAAVLTLAGSEALLCAVVFPRVRHPAAAGRPRYFGHVAQFADAEQLTVALTRDPDPEHRAVDQLLRVSKIVQTKYVLIAAALAGLTAAVILGAVAVVVTLL